MAKKKKKADDEIGFRVAILHFGYVESSQVSNMILIRQSGESEAMTKAAALKSVAEFFFKKWLEDHEWMPELKKCCAATKEKDANAKFCTKCGQTLDLPGFDHEDYTQWLAGQLHQTADDWGGYEGDWWPWNTVAEVVEMYQAGFKCLEVRENAEHLLARAIDPDAKWLPEPFRAGVRELHKSIIEHHASNRLSKKGLGIDGLLEEDAKTFEEIRKGLDD